MADPTSDALLGLQFSPAESGYGIAQQSLSQLTPQLITPYTSTGKAIGLGLGSVLLQSLLGYQARQSALEDTLQANTLANQLLEFQKPQERISFIEQLDTSPAISGRLSALATALTQQEQARKATVALSSEQEIAKLRALGDFYATPEGQQTREFELKKIKEEAEARRTPLETLLAQEEAKKMRQLAVEDVKQSGRKELLDLQTRARTGDREAEAELKLKRDEAARQHDIALSKIKTELGEQAAVNKAQRLAQLENDLIDTGLDPESRRAQAKIALTQEMQQELLRQRDEMQQNRLKQYNDAITERMTLRKRLDAEYPAITAKVKDDASQAPSFANLAKDLAADIRKISSYPEYKAATSLSAVGDEQLKSRTIDIADRLTRLRSGMATRGAEDDKLQKIALGDLSVGPQEAANILERLSNDTLRVAADRLAAATQKPTDLVQFMRQAAEQNSRVELQPRIYQGGAVSNEPAIVAPVQDEKLQILRQLQTELAAEKAKRGR